VNVWQSPELCDQLNDSPLQEMNGNVYVKNTSSSLPMLFWSPVKDTKNCHTGYESLADFQKAQPYESQGMEYSFGSIPLFKGALTGNFETLPDFPGHKAASQLPANVSHLLKLSNRQKTYVGAHPAK
jgi:hypothetical protein